MFLLVKFRNVIYLVATVFALSIGQKIQASKIEEYPSLELGSL